MTEDDMDEIIHYFLIVSVALMSLFTGYFLVTEAFQCF